MLLPLVVVECDVAHSATTPERMMSGGVNLTTTAHVEVAVDDEEADVSPGYAMTVPNNDTRMSCPLRLRVAVWAFIVAGSSAF
jgi:hypothetical protein